MTSPRAFAATRGGAPWAYSALVRDGLADVVDDEGRPLAERRAPARVRGEAPLVLRSCPYADDRGTRPMNVSALAQITAHFKATLDDLAAFRATQGDAGGWEPVLTAVVDQLGGPVLYLLRHPDRTIVPARVAVGHKLSAGYFGVVRELVALAARGCETPVTAGALLAFAHTTGAFAGPSEVCAGPPPLILRATEVLVEGRAGIAPLDDHARVTVARAHRQQIQLEIAWEQFDRALEPHVLELLAAAPAHTRWFRRKLDNRRSELLARAPAAVPRATAAFPSDLDPNRATRLAEALARDQPCEATAATLAGFPAHEAGPLELEPAIRARVLDALGRLLDAYLVEVEILAMLEQELRRVLGDLRPATIDVTSIPRLVTLPWLEAALGIRISCTSGPPARLAIAPLPRPVTMMGYSYSARR